MRKVYVIAAMALVAVNARAEDFDYERAREEIAEYDRKIREATAEYDQRYQQNLENRNAYEARRVQREPSPEETAALIRADESFGRYDAAHSRLIETLKAGRDGIAEDVAVARDAEAMAQDELVDRNREAAALPPAQDKPAPTRLDAETIALYRAESERRNSQGVTTMGIGWLLIGALIGYAASQKKGFSPVAGVLGGALLGLLSPLLFFVSGTGIKAADGRKCPDCAELIKADAKVCRHCGKRFEA